MKSLLQSRSANAVLLLISTIVLVGILTFTNPERTIQVVPFVFVLIFLVIFLALNFVGFMLGEVKDHGSLYVKLILSGGIVAIIMIYSTQNMGLADLLIIGVIVAGLLFYVSRRV